jgi:flagellar protein FlaG
MADVSIPSLILFIASMVVAAGVAGVLVDTVSGISGALDDRGADMAKEIRTDIEIISDPEGGVYDSDADDLTLYVKNTGLRPIPADPAVVDVLVNGTYRTDVTVSVVDGTDWRPQHVVKLTVTDVSLPGGEDHWVKVVIDGEEETFEFRL